MLLMVIGLSASSQVEYKVELLPDGQTYQVVLRPTVDWTGPQAITATAQVTLIVPTGGFALGNIQSANGSWSNNSNIIAPTENSGFDYVTIGLTSLGTMDIEYLSGQETVLFSFQNTGDCTGAVELMAANDPFLPPNSENANVGNQITTLGSGNINAWIGNYGVGLANCAGPNDPDSDGDGTPDSADCAPNDATAATVDNCDVCGGDGSTCADADGDGVIASEDPDDNDPCVPDSSDGTCDTDQDGVINADDCAPEDATIAIIDDCAICGGDGSTCADADGDGVVASEDPDDNDPCVPDSSDGTCDTDNDGVANADDCAPEDATIAVIDDCGICGGDGSDCTDADGDGVAASNDPDDNDPCVPDNLNGACDTDGDGVADGEDCDPNDATAAIVDACDVCGGDGSTCVDADSDGVAASEDPDDNDPCVPDNLNGACDTDGDGVADGEDCDPNDATAAIVDACDVCGGDGSTCVDADSDGVAASEDPDDNDPCVPDNLNGACDTDGDGVADGEDCDPTDATAAIVDACDVCGGDGSTCVDADSDGVAASEDPDDNDPCVPNQDAANCEQETEGMVAFDIELLPDGCTYQVVAVPDVDWVGAQATTSTAQITFVTPTGGFDLGSIQSVSGTWSSNGTIIAPAENVNADYVSVGLTSLGTTDITYTAGEPTVLFTFSNMGDCSDGNIMLMDGNDPFMAPNSQNANVGNQITTLGSGNINAWNGAAGTAAACVSAADNDGDGLAACVDPNDDDECVPNNVGPNCIQTAPDSGVAGRIYYDFNSNGEMDNGENGVPNVTVTATDEAGNSISTVSDGNGDYTLEFDECAGEILVEFDVDGYNAANDDNLFESFANSTAAGTGSESVTCVSFQPCGEAGVNLGLISAEDYCEENPRMAIPCYVNGNPLAGGSAADPGAFVGFEYDRDGEGANYQTDPPSAGSAGLPDEIASAEQIGATWGNAWDFRSENIFTSAVVRRHSGFGPLGAGGIYAINYPEGGTPTVSNFLDLGTCTNVGSLNRNDLPAEKNIESNDIDAFLGVGKIGLGDLDISTDGTELWTVNLNTKELVKVDIRNMSTDALNTPGCGDVTTYAIPQPCGGETRPWATKYYRGKVYIGLVCSGENGGALSSFVYEFNPTSDTFTQVYTESLDYMKGCTTQSIECTWNAWSDDFDDASFTFGNSEIANPQAILSDIEFDVDGSMILGYADRFGFQTGTRNNWNFSSGTVLVSGNSGGDIRYVYNDNGTFVGEQNGNIVDANGNIVRTGCSDGGDNGVEFFCGDLWAGSGGDFHLETALGGLALNNGTGEVVTSAFDPKLAAFAGGVKYLSTADGSEERGYSVFYNANDPEEGFGKSTGVGDIELLCGPAPIEIGNRVWVDVNLNGIQDPGEEILSGVTVELFQNNQLVGTTTTAADGTYYFNQSNVNGGLAPLTEYKVCIPVATLIGDLSDYELTSTDSGNNDKLDNDAALDAEGNASITFTTGEYGQNDHTLDFGVTEILEADLELTKSVDQSVVNVGDQVTWTITLTNLGPAAATGVTVEDMLPNGLSVVSASEMLDPVAGAPVPTFTWNVGNLGVNETVTLTILTSVDGVGPYTNVAQVATVDQPDPDSTPGNNDPNEDDQDEDTVGGELIDLELVKTVDQASVNVGDDVTWTITVTNEGPADATGITVVDALPGGLTPSAITPSIGTFDAATLTWTIGDLANDGIATLTIVTTVDTEGTITNSAQIETADQPDVDSTPGNDNPNEDDQDDETITSVLLLASLGDFTFIDNNESGTQDAGDTPVGGITVNLYNADDLTTPIATTTTDAATGEYSFDDLDPNEDYVVEFETPDGFTPTQAGAGASTGNPTDSDPGASGFTDVIDLDPGEDDTTIDAGYVPMGASLGDFVFVDADEDGMQDVGEDPIEGVVVNLYDADDLTTPIATTTTDNMGAYIFPNLDPNEDYVIEFETPEGFDPTTQSGNASDGNPNDSDAGTDGFTDVIDLNPGENDPTIDAGFVPEPTASLGDFVFVDADEDGIQDAGEVTIEGATVNLYDADDLTTPIATTTTDANGEYSFDDLDPAEDYVVEFEEPTGFDPTTQSGNASDGIADDSDAGTDGFTDVIDLDAGEDDTTIDAGFVPEPQPTASLGDLVFVDEDADGIQDPGEDPIEGVVVNLYDADDLTTPIATTTTNAFGQYSFDDLDPAEDYVVEFEAPTGFDPTTQSGNASDGTPNDSDAGADGFTDVIDLDPAEDDTTIDAGFVPEPVELASLGDYTFIDANENGIQDATEMPLEGVTVNLYTSSNVVTPIGTTTTDANGEYSFDDLDPNVDYVVQFEEPTGFNPTAQSGNASDGVADDSDAGANGFTDVIDLDPSEDDTTIDAGFVPEDVPLASLGDLVFVDEDADGIQDPGEDPIEGVVVNLYDADDLTIPIATTTTNAFGQYSFDDLNPAEDYVVEFEEPTGFDPTTQSGNASDGTPNDSDAGADGFTDAVDLMPGEDDTTIDAGFVPEPEPIASLGDFTFIDENENGIQDANEQPLGGVVVNLYDADDLTTPIGTTTTDGNGEYSFDNLDPAEDYVVEFMTPTGFDSTPQSGNASDGTPNDSDAGADGFTDVVDLDPFEDDTTIDAGFIPEPSACSVFLEVQQPGCGLCNGSITANVSGEMIDDVNQWFFQFYDNGNFEGQPIKINATKFPPELYDELCPGDYSLRVTGLAGEVDGCIQELVITLIDPEENLNPTLAVTEATCEEGGTITFDAGGTGDFTLTLTPGNEVATTNQSFTFTDLAPGAYTINLQSDLGCNADLDTLVVGPDACATDLELTKTSMATGTQIGDQVTYTISVVNLGPLDATGVTVSDDLPAQLSYINADGAYNDATGIWTIGDLAIGETVNLNITTEIIAAGTITNSAQIETADQPDTDSTPGNDSPNEDDQDDDTIEANELGSIGDTVFNDEDGDGVQDPGEEGIPGVIVTLTLPDGTEVTTITDNTGTYTFDDLPAGDYTVTVGEGPEGFDPTTPTMMDVTLTEGENNDDIDFGFNEEELGSIGDTVFNDEDGDGVQDPGEEGIAGVIVTLTYPDGTEETTVTNGTGEYIFDDLPEGDYIVTVGEGPDGTAPTTPTTDMVMLAEGEDYVDADFGFIETPLGTIGDTVFEDPNENGIQDPGEDGIPGVVVTLTYPDGTEEVTVTDNNGNYMFDELPEGMYTVTVGDGPVGTTPTTPTEDMVNLAEGEDYMDADFGFDPEELGSIGDTVFEDPNENGVQNPGEDGIAGVVVTLTYPDGTEESTVTNGVGEYIFDDLPEGMYTVTVGDGPEGTDLTTPGTDDVMLAEGEDYVDADFGFDPEELGSIGDTVFDDPNENGVQDPGEDGIGGVIVTLTNPDGTEETTVTNGAGEYIFDELPEGDYIVTVGDGPEGTSPTTPVTDMVALEEGEDYVDADFGFNEDPLGTIGDTVFEDPNENGVQDPGEDGIPGVVVTLTYPDGTEEVTVTDNNGNYTFDDLPEGMYTVTVGDGPDGTTPTTPTEDMVDLAEGEDYMDADFGFDPDELGSIGDTVFEDPNENGVQNPGEDGIGGVVVTLTYPDGTEESTVTNGAGEYIFDELPEGMYTVTVGDGPEGTDLTTPGTDDVMLAEGEDYVDADFGFDPEDLGSIGDTVFNDEDGDGVQDPGEMGIPGVIVTLTYPDGTEETTVTDNTGTYTFDDLPEGDYIVTVGDGPDGTSPTTPTSEMVTLEEGEDNMDVDFGFNEDPLGTIGDTVFEDENGDGVQNPGEDGIPGVTVTLTYPDGTEEVTITDNDGNYMFDDLPAGDYTVTVGDGPEGFDPTTPEVVDVTLEEGEDNMDVDFGFNEEELGSIGDTVFEDPNENGVQDAGEDGIPGVVVTLTNPDGTEEVTVTDNTGTYTFDDLPAGDYTVTVGDGPEGTDLTTPGTDDVMLAEGEDYVDADFGFDPEDLGSIGDTVFEDSNENGVQDPGEDGIPGVTVTITYPDGTEETTVTDNTGTYIFDELPEGDYIVTVGEGPDGTSPTTPTSEMVTLEEGEDNMDVDFGFNEDPLGTIGDTVFEDENGDGVQNPGEDGIPGVTVTLTYPDGTEEVTVTDNDGNYMFDDLPAGDYTVTVGDGPEGFDPTTPEVVDVTLEEGEDNMDVDFGFNEEELGSIGDFVWLDEDKDGVQDAGEPGIPNVPVTLTYPDGTEETTLTDGAGQYLFDELPAGDYIVTVGDGPDGTELTTGDTDNVMLDEGEDYVNADFGFAPEELGSIGDTVFEDPNENGVQDPGEDGIAGVVVTLTNPDGTEETTVTDGNGEYIFDELPEGMYTVTVEDGPEGSEPTTPTEDMVALDEGEDYVDADFGFDPEDLGSIGDSVFNDEDGDGVQDPGEMGIPGVIVTLTNPDGSQETTVTDNTGTYTFEDLPEGDYIVEVGEGPDGTSPTTPVTDMVALEEGEDYVDADFGFMEDPLGSIGDTVFEDPNENGVQDPGEDGIPGVIVTITYPDGTEEITVTDGDGNYVFTDLPAGDYTVEVGDGPEGSEPTTDTTMDVTLGDGEDNMDVDFGFNPEDLGSIGDFVFEDENGDGIQNPGEDGIPGVTVTLTYPDGTEESVVTDPDGEYLFEDLPEGDYTVTVGEGPEGTELTTPATDDVTLGEGEEYVDADFGFDPEDLGSIGDTVFEDTNENGVQDPGEMGIPGVTVTLTNPDGTEETTVTDNTGTYEFTDLPEGTYTVTVGDGPEGTDPTTPISDMVALDEGEEYEDADFGFAPEQLGSIGDTVFEDTNENGVQDPGEEGIPGVIVTLTNPDGSEETMITDGDGEYLFEDLPEGDYTVTVGDGPEGSDPTTPISDMVALDEGEEYEDADFGFAPEQLGSIGDTVFEDTNENGVQDPGEDGIPGVVVTLTNPDGTEEIMVTDNTGTYEFTDLPEGDYTVTVGEGPEGTELTTPATDDVTLGEGEEYEDADFGFAPEELGSIGDFVFNDVDGDGVQDPGDTGIPGVLVTLTNPDGTQSFEVTDGSGMYLFEDLPEGDYTVTVGDGPDGTMLSTPATDDVTLGEGEDYEDADFGFTPEVLGAIGDFVFNDANDNGVQDPGEMPVPGVLVTLTYPDGTQEFMITDGAGEYLFEDLPAGDYTVTVGNGPQDTNLTTPGSFDITLAEGETNLTADFGFAPDIPMIDLELTKIAEYDNAFVGEMVSYILTVTNEGPDFATNVTVEDVLPAGIGFWSAEGDGTYNANSGVWEVGDIPINGSASIEIKVKIEEEGPILNVAQVTGADQEDIDSTPNNDDGNQSEDDEDNEMIEAVLNPATFLVDISLTKEVYGDGGVFDIGDEVIYEIYVRNDGLGYAESVVVEDVLPAGLTFVEAAATTGEYDPATGAWTLDLQGGDIERIYITAEITGEGSIENIAQVVFASLPDIDSTPDNDDGDQSEDDEAAASIFVNPDGDPMIDLELVKSVSPHNAFIGDTVKYSIKLYNRGPSAASGVTVLDQLPDGVEFISSTATMGEYDAATGIWTVGEQPEVDCLDTLCIYAVVTGVGSIENLAQVLSADQPDVDSTPNNNDQTEDDMDGARINSQTIDLRLEKTIVGDDDVEMGDEVTFELKVSNNSQIGATGVEVTDILPTGLTFVSASSGDYDDGTGIWTVGSVNALANATIEITATADAFGTLTNTAEITAADQPDTDSTPGNGDTSEDDMDSATVSVTSLEPCPEQESELFACTGPLTPIVLCVDFCTLGDEYEISQVESTFNCSVSILSENCFRYTPLPGFEMIGEDMLTVTATNAAGAEDEITYTVTVSEDCDGEEGFFNPIQSEEPAQEMKMAIEELNIPNVITPNGDGINDNFTVKGMENVEAQSVELTIFNRYGQVIYQDQDFQFNNNWNGTADGYGQNLDQGTYFYQLRFITTDGDLIDKAGFIEFRK